MSYKAVQWVLDLRWPRKGVAPTKMVLLALAHHYNEAEGRAYPSVGLLADECSMTVRQVHRHLRVLESTRFGEGALKGIALLETVSERRWNGTQRASTYHLPAYEVQRQQSDARVTRNAEQGDTDVSQPA